MNGYYTGMSAYHTLIDPLFAEAPAWAWARVEAPVREATAFAATTELLHALVVGWPGGCAGTVTFHTRGLVVRLLPGDAVKLYEIAAAKVTS